MWQGHKTVPLSRCEKIADDVSVQEHTGEKIARQRVCNVPEYIADPLCIGRKFDLRVYVLVTSFDPLRVYVFREDSVVYTQEYDLDCNP